MESSGKMVDFIIRVNTVRQSDRRYITGFRR